MLDGYQISFASVRPLAMITGLDPATTSQRGTVILRTKDADMAYRTLTDNGAPGLAAPTGHQRGCAWY